MYPDSPNALIYDNKIDQVFKSSGEVSYKQFPTQTFHIWTRLAYENNVTTDQILEILRYSKILREIRSILQTDKFENISVILFVSSVFFFFFFLCV